MNIGRICTRNVDVTTADESVKSAATRMSDRKVGALIVVDPQQRPVGILTDRDLAVRVVARAEDPCTTTVADVMSPSPSTIDENTPFETAFKLMRVAQCRRLPVVGEDGRLIGIVSLDDILRVMAYEFTEINALLVEESPTSLASCR